MCMTWECDQKNCLKQKDTYMDHNFSAPPTSYIYVHQSDPFYENK